MIEPPFKPAIKADTDVQNVDPEFLAEPPEETPVVDNELLKRSAMDGEFDNFTYINQSNMSEIDRITSTQSGNTVKPFNSFNRQSFMEIDPYQDLDQSGVGMDQAGVSAHSAAALNVQ